MEEIEDLKKQFLNDFMPLSSSDLIICKIKCACDLGSNHERVVKLQDGLCMCGHIFQILVLCKFQGQTLRLNSLTEESEVWLPRSLDACLFTMSLEDLMVNRHLKQLVQAICQN